MLASQTTNSALPMSEQLSQQQNSDQQNIDDKKTDKLKRYKDLSIVGVGFSALASIAGITMVATLYPAGAINVVAVPLLIGVPLGFLGFFSRLYSRTKKNYEDHLAKVKNQEHSATQVLEDNGQSLSEQNLVSQSQDSQRSSSEGQDQGRSRGKDSTLQSMESDSTLAEQTELPRSERPSAKFADIRRDLSPRRGFGREGSMER